MPSLTRHAVVLMLIVTLASATSPAAAGAAQLAGDAGGSIGIDPAGVVEDLKDSIEADRTTADDDPPNTSGCRPGCVSF